MASFTQPERIVNSGWLEHGPFAFWLMEQLKPKLTVELGTERGFSFGCFCQANKEMGIGGRVIAVDTWKGDEHAGFVDKLGDKIYQELQQHVAENYAGIGELKRMYFSDALKDVADGSVNLLHVDGRHFYDDAKEDHTTWIPKLAPGAVVLFHDTQVKTHGFGVYRYWDELSRKYPSFEFEHGHGLGILQNDTLPPGPLADLLSPSLDARTRQDVKTMYARLGSGISETYEHRRFERRFNDRKHPFKKAAKELMRPFQR
jgi:Methyltransferase domain